MSPSRRHALQPQVHGRMSFSSHTHTVLELKMMALLPAEGVGGPSDELVEAFKGHASVQPLCAEELAQNDRLRTMRGEADDESAADLEDALVHQYDDSYAEMDAVGDDEPAESFWDLDPN